MRLLCGLRQIDVWASTGVPLFRIAGAERGQFELSDGEQTLLVDFLRERWASLQALEHGVANRQSTQIARAG